MPATPLQHFLRQLKFLVPGVAATWYLQTHQEVRSLILAGSAQGWSRFAAVASVSLGCVTILLFLYVMLIPWFKGVQPNYHTWRESGVLSSVIPTLTATIVTGWLSLVFTLGQWSSLGYAIGTVGASGLYLLTFGLLGLIPAPKPPRHSQ